MSTEDEAREAYDARLTARAVAEAGRLAISARTDRSWLLRDAERPGWSNWGWAEIVVLSRGRLLLHGDDECLVFGTRHDPARPLDAVATIAAASGEYDLHKLLSRGPDQDAFYAWDIGVAEADLLRMVAEIRQEVHERCRIPEMEDLDRLDRTSPEELAGLARRYDEPATPEDDLAVCLAALRERRVEAWIDDEVAKIRDHEALQTALDHIDEVPRDALLWQIHDDGESIDDEALSSIGRVVAPGIFFAHAAIRRLWALLEAERVMEPAGTGQPPLPVTTRDAGPAGG